MSHRLAVVSVLIDLFSLAGQKQRGKPTVRAGAINARK